MDFFDSKKGGLLIYCLNTTRVGVLPLLFKVFIKHNTVIIRKTTCPNLIRDRITKLVKYLRNVTYHWVRHPYVLLILYQGQEFLYF